MKSMGIAVVCLWACGPRVEVDGETGQRSLAAACEDACAHMQACAPEVLATLWEDEPACRVGCEDTFSSPNTCRDASFDYLDCTAELACEEFPALAQNPANTSCSTAWAPAFDACFR
jgi:hypothetical protein